MGAPVAEIEAVRQGTRRILLAVGDLTDEQAAAPSRLPGWTRAEVLTHLARNADGGRGIAEAAARGEIGAQYPGGVEQRSGGYRRGTRSRRERRCSPTCAGRATRSWSRGCSFPTMRGSAWAAR